MRHFSEDENERAAEVAGKIVDLLHDELPTDSQLAQLTIFMLNSAFEEMNEGTIVLTDEMEVWIHGLSDNM